MKTNQSLLLAAILVAPLSANAAIISGWGAYSSVSTNSNCPSYCSGGTSEYANDGIYEGGSTSATTRLANTSGSAAASSSLSGTGFTPTLRATSTATVNAGAQSTAFAVQGYTYTGTADTVLTLDFSLHGINSSTDASIRGDMAILRGNDLYFYPDFGTQVYEAGADMIDTFNGVESISNLFMSGVGESTMTGFLNINLSQGDDFFVVSSLQASAFRDSSADAFNTLTMKFSGVGVADLRAASVSAVPVPAAVWLFASGLIGLMGFARRKA